ncbi:MAG TPA: hypothetical protein VNZ01_12735 [Solirubrobacteraceae bacterium]|jgi:hypothetical protein|nr:hypothetical protein [Solirubrobacteraceae bacterium]
MSLPAHRTGRFGSALRRHCALPALVVAALSCTAQPALSAPAGLVVIPRPTSQPGLSYFKLQAKPGSAARPGTIELRNPTGRPLQVVLAPVDGETLGTLGSSYAPPGSRANGSTLWLQVLRRPITVPPGAGVAVPISVRVPSAVQPGDYLSGVSVQALDQRAGSVAKKGLAIANVTRYAIGVEVTVPGVRHALIRFTGAEIRRQPAGLTFLLRASNRGNAILQGVHGFVRITRGARVVVSRPIEAGTFIAHTSIAYPVPAFRQTPSQGTRYRIVAWMRYAGGIARLDTYVSFGHREAGIARQYLHGPAAAGGGTPWWELAAAVAVILYALGTTILLLWRRREREPQAIQQ